MYKEILDKIVRTEYRPSLDDWALYAKDNDRIGLEIIYLVYKSKGTEISYKGNKNISYKLPEEKAMYETQTSFMSKDNKLWSYRLY
jgi:hypothetical protein